MCSFRCGLTIRRDSRRGLAFATRRPAFHTVQCSDIAFQTVENGGFRTWPKFLRAPDLVWGAVLVVGDAIARGGHDADEATANGAESRACQGRVDG